MKPVKTSGKDAMRKFAISLVAVTTVFASSALTCAVQAADPCKAHTNQADCSADKTCSWSATKKKCAKMKWE
jgi:hypothetical protein